MSDTWPELELAAQGGNEAMDHFARNHSIPHVSGDSATFIFHGDVDEVFLQHWVFGLGSHNPFTRMAGTNWWRLTIEFPRHSRIEYKIGVAKDGHEVWLHDPLNPRIAHDPFGGNSVVQMTGYEEPEWSLPVATVPRGTLESWKIQSKSLHEQREIRVYLPSRYRENRRHRIMFVHDGDDYMRFCRFGAVLDNLTYRREIPPMVVVLLNPHDRLREYAGDRRHAAFVVEEVVPEIEKRYPVISEPSARCLAGASFGGVASLSTAWYYPNTFDMLLLQSGSFAFTDIGQHARGRVFDPVVEFMNRFRKQVGQPAKRIFLSCGVYESLIYENRSFVPLLQKHGIEVKFVEARDGHNWENWRDRLRSGLTWLFPVPLWFYYE